MNVIDARCRICTRTVRVLTGEANLCYACRCDMRFAAKHPEPIGFYGNGLPIWAGDASQQHGLEG